MRAGTNTLPTLRAGDVVDVVAPASACSPEQLARGVQVLRSWGLEPRVPRGLFGSPYIYANEDSVRWAQLRTALVNRTSRAVWCVRGGYGSGRLLGRIARMGPPTRKLFVGLSDITALHTFLVQRWGWPTLHGPMLSQLGGDELAPRVVEEARRLVLGEQRTLRWCGLVPLNPAACRRRRVRGRLLGGNLKTLQSQLGTPWALQARGGILVLEDVNERGYAIDRMLVQLAQCGALRGVRAIAFGTFNGGREPDGRFTGTEVLERFAGETRVPVLAGLPFGHGPDDRALPFGLECTVELGERGALSLAWESDRGKEADRVGERARKRTGERWRAGAGC